MKKIYITAVALLFSAASCNDSFIHLAPHGQQSSATFFQTEEHFAQAIAAAYVPLRGLVETDYLTAEMRSDNTHFERSQVRGVSHERRENIANFQVEAGNTFVYDIYKACYNGISRANIVIGRIVDADIPQEAKDAIAGQAKFLRAFFYFKLVRHFGGVPLYLKEVTNADEAFLLRSSVDEVYAQIIADASDAVQQLLPPTSFPQSGAATKGAATMLLAEVYMVQKKYEEAEQLLKTLEPMGYQLLLDYASVFSTSHKNSEESIFEVQYMEGLQEGQQSNFIYLFLPRTPNTEVITGVATANQGRGGYNVPSKDIIDAYESGDKRKDISIGVAEGTVNANGYLRIQANKSIVDYVTPEGKVGIPYIKKYLNPHTTPNNTDDNWPIYRYAGALLMLAEALNEQNKQDEALPLLNKVRDRAFGAGVATVVTTDQAELRDIIAHERRMELAFENHRWHDLVRTGEAIEVMTAYGEELKKEYNYLHADSYHVTPEQLIYPIPRREIELNPELTQNAGYN